MRRCPYCAEEIQDAAVICRFCGRSVTPVRASETSPAAPKQSWYRLDDRVCRESGPQEPPRPKGSLWSKLGGAAMNALGPRRHADDETQARVERYAKIGLDRKARGRD